MNQQQFSSSAVNTEARPPPVLEKENTMTFKNAINNQLTTTLNGMVAFKQTNNACVDLFYKIGASRHQDIQPDFVKAYVENPELALRIAAWARDIREGSGERASFRKILNYLEVNQPQDCLKLMRMVPELGRWDDLLVLQTPDMKAKAFTMIHDALKANNGLAAKWMPRQGQVATELRKHFGLTPKAYRQWLVSLTNVVETPMAANNWESIDYNKVPSLAMSRYKRAFNRHGLGFKAYVQELSSGNPNVKVNATAVYPYDVLKGRLSHRLNYDKTELDLIEAQWNALPNYVGASNVLPLVDVSGSMGIQISESLTAMDVAVSLGLYFADKNQGVFKDCFLTFSGEPELLNLQGSVNQKIDQMVRSKWGMNTDLNKALNLILQTATDGQVSQQEMPEILIILSDMQFDRCANLTGFEMIKEQYSNAGYTCPNIVFWNLKAYGNVPVRFNQDGVALISGFSPAIAEAFLSGDISNFTPEGIMLKKIMNERYDPNMY